VYGVESQLWSETIKGRDMMEYSILPKLLGFAESAWTERKWENVADDATRKKMIQEGWNQFANSMAQKHLPRLKYLNGGYNYRIPMPGAMIENGELKANTELPGLAIRYTTDGSEPTEQSQLYHAPVKISGTVKLKSFDLAGKSSRTQCSSIQIEFTAPKAQSNTQPHTIDEHRCRYRRHEPSCRDRIWWRYYAAEQNFTKK
jgi:hexosaminidase